MLKFRVDFSFVSPLSVDHCFPPDLSGPSVDRHLPPWFFLMARTKTKGKAPIKMTARKTGIGRMSTTMRKTTGGTLSHSPLGPAPVQPWSLPPEPPSPSPEPSSSSSQPPSLSPEPPSPSSPDSVITEQIVLKEQATNGDGASPNFVDLVSNQTSHLSCKLTPDRLTVVLALW